MGINSAGDNCASNPVQQLSSEDETESDDPPPAAKRVALEASEPLFTNVAQVIGSHYLSASTRHSLLNHHFRPCRCEVQFPKGFHWHWSFFSASMASVFPVACLQQTNQWWLLLPVRSLRSQWLPWVKPRCASDSSSH